MQALLRRPEGASEAYLAMVEENEIRVGLSHYERARIAARAAEQGVYPSLKSALQHLFANASRAKRSKIGSFVTVYRHLDGALRFPAALPERLGLALAQALEADPDPRRPAPQALAAAQPTSAAAEQALLTRLLAPAKDGPPAPAPEPVAPGIWLDTTATPRGPRLTLSGEGDRRSLRRSPEGLAENRRLNVSRAKHSRRKTLRPRPCPPFAFSSPPPPAYPCPEQTRGPHDRPFRSPPPRPDRGRKSARAARQARLARGDDAGRARLPGQRDLPHRPRLGRPEEVIEGVHIYRYPEPPEAHSGALAYARE